MDELDYASRIAMLQTLGVRLTEIGDRHATVEVVVADAHRNYYGGAHGGLIATLLDTVCFFPRPLIPAGLRLATSSLAVAYVRPARVGDRLVARSELRHLGRRMATLSAHVSDGEGRLVAHGTVTLVVLSEEAAGA